MLTSPMSGEVTSDGFVLTYIVEGEGVPVVIIGSALYYQRLFSSQLKKNLQLIFIDHRGFAIPPDAYRSTADYELEVLLDDIELIRRTLGLNRFVVLGHSGHAFMALEYAKKYSQHVAGVVMIGVTPDYSPQTHQEADRFFNEQASPERKAFLAETMQQLPDLIASDPDRRFVAYCLAAGPKSWYDYAFDARFLWEGVYTNMAMIDYVWGDVFRNIDCTKNLDTLRVPVFLVLGQYDFLTGPVHLWDKVKTAFADIRIEVFARSAHAPQYEEADQFDQKLLAWIDEKISA